MKLREQWRKLASRLPVRQQQILVAIGILASGVGLLWMVLALSASGNAKAPPRAASAKEKVIVRPEQDGITPLRVDPVDQWVGTAGRTLAQYKSDKDAQERINAERKEGEQRLMDRLAELERRQAELRPDTPLMPAPRALQERALPAALPPTMQRPAPVPHERTAAVAPDMTGYPPGTPAAPLPTVAATTPVSADTPPALVRVNLPAPPASGKSAQVTGDADRSGDSADGGTDTTETFLPVSFMRGELLTGIMAPTGGQAQSNPLPVLIRVLDNAVLPNQYRSEVKECFVIASGHGQVSDSRAYMRTVNLSCIRRDGPPIEAKIKGNVLGEDGMLGVQGKLVTMQGQMLANALRAGIVSGIGQGFAQSGTTFTATPFGTLATNQGGVGDSLQRGVVGGVGRALDNLANYYIKLAEATFPVIEVGAKRQVHIMLTEGVRLPRLTMETRDANDD